MTPMDGRSHLCFSLLGAVMAFVLSTAATSQTVHAATGSLPFDLTKYPDPRSLLTDSIVQAMVKTVGFSMDHRPMQPATPLGTSLGLDLGLQVSLVKVPDEFKTEFAKLGVSTTNIPPALPIPRAMVHKGLGSVVDIGASWVGYKSYRAWGGDVKFCVSQPEEGLTWALRVNYSTAKIEFVETKTWTPQVLVSKKMAFADPYLGVGYQHVSGKVKISYPVPADIVAAAQLAGIAVPSKIEVEKEAKLQGGMAFMGVGMQFGPLPLKITMEGGYSTVKMHTLSTMLSFVF